MIVTLVCRVTLDLELSHLLLKTCSISELLEQFLRGQSLQAPFDNIVIDLALLQLFNENLAAALRNNVLRYEKIVFRVVTETLFPVRTYYVGQSSAQDLKIRHLVDKFVSTLLITKVVKNSFNK